MTDGRSRNAGKGRPRGARRTPPPDATGRETQTLAAVQQAGDGVEVELIDGERLAGTIAFHDAHAIKLRLADGRELFLRKARIRSIVLTEA